MSQQNKGNLYILLTAVLWSTGGILIKYIPGNAMMINGARSLIALLFFWICKDICSSNVSGLYKPALRNCQ